tara:strand:- start:3293 stop:3739 length:447 start_codon:yes stop_codon:yes gene_type:complete
VPNHIHPITIRAALETASDLLPEDRREIEEGHGVDPFQYFLTMGLGASSVYFTAPNGRTAGMAGVSNDGQIWMLCTSQVRKYPTTFAREAKRFVEGRSDKLLWNIVDKRNKLHLKLLKFLGFKFLREIKHGPNQLPFIEFCYVHGKSQ